LIVDVHSHFFPDRFLKVLTREGAAHGAHVEEHPAGRIIWSSPRQSARVGPVFYDVAARLEALERWGIDLQALSLSPPMLYWAPPALGRELAAAFNDELVTICRAHADRFVPLATLPLQDVEAAVAETERAARAGCRGVYIGTNVNGRYLDDAAFTPLWEAAGRLGLPVFTHPVNNAGEDRMVGWHLANSVGNPSETALCGARLIMAGVLDRFPDLRVVLAHGGGTLAFIAGRLDHAYEVRPECRSAIPQAPSAYLRRLYFDTITFDDRGLRFLIDTAGADRVALGTDYAYDMADPDVLPRIRRLGLAPRDAEAICRGTGARLLGLEAERG
jgi:aminocarboxymuconate-semialdehyde decarboxylase